MLSFLPKWHRCGDIAIVFMSAVPMLFGLALTLPTFVLVVVLACFKSWDQFFFIFFEIFRSLGLGGLRLWLALGFEFNLLCLVHFYQAYCTLDIRYCHITHGGQIRFHI